MQVACEAAIASEIYDRFSFTIKDAKYHPLVRRGRWSGIVGLFEKKHQTLYNGLLRQLIGFAYESGYSIKIGAGFSYPIPLELDDFVATLDLPFEPREYQMEYLEKALSLGRCVLLSPTGSGKSLIIYLIFRYLGERALLMVPTSGLVEQMVADFISYGYPASDISTNLRGSEAPVTICCWQSVHRITEPEFFDRFGVVFGDEAHVYAAKSLVGIMERMAHCRWRFGTTGTLASEDMKTERLVLEGLFGPVCRQTTTRALIDSKRLAEVSVNAMVLCYGPDEQLAHATVIKEAMADGHKRRGDAKKAAYEAEIDWLITNKRRNEFIRDLVLSLRGNTVVLYRYLNRGEHGPELYRLISEATDRKVYFMSGAVSAGDREEVRQLMEHGDDAIVVASSGVFSTGVNIVSLRNLVLTTPSKARVGLLQSIGRILRRSDDKTKCDVYDLADCLPWCGEENVTFRQFGKRLAIYREEGIPYTLKHTEMGASV